MHVGGTSAIFIGNVTEEGKRARDLDRRPEIYAQPTSFPRRSFEPQLLRPGRETSNAGGLRDFAQMHQRPRLFFSTVEFIGAPKSSMEL